MFVADVTLLYHLIIICWVLVHTSQCPVLSEVMTLWHNRNVYIIIVISIIIVIIPFLNLAYVLVSTIFSGETL